LLEDSLGKKLLVFSDGTGNSSAKAEKTNVWRLFQAVDQSLPDQLVKYDDGVGTSSNKYLAALGGVFGWGLKRNVIDLYKFVCRNHQDGDEIYGFGFSRGAFTIRMLIGLVSNQGLPAFRSEEELHANAVLAYRRFRSERFPSWSPFVLAARKLRDLVLKPFTGTASEALAAARREIPVRFLGLWDTVAAYEMPVDELKWGLSLVIWPMVSADRRLSPLVQRACHALSLDDQRQTFHPILFDESNEDPEEARISQVWFAGVHSNVGGGYPEDQLSLVTLDWMISQLRPTGVRLDATLVAELASDRSAFARIYDSRAGFASYYRYSPRAVDMGCDRARQPVRPVVHGSVVVRMAKGSDAYAPISLPSRFDVLAPDGTLLPMTGFSSAELRAPPVKAQAVPATTAQDVTARTDLLRGAIGSFAAVDDEMVRQVADSVWWRRVAYFGCFFSTVVVALFPYFGPYYGRAAKFLIAHIPFIGEELLRGTLDLSRRFNPAWQGWTVDLFNAIGSSSIVPGFAHGWLVALSEQPLQMLLALAVVALFFGTGQFLGQRIHDRAWFAWHSAKRGDYLDWAIRSSRSSLKKAVGLTLATVVLWVLARSVGASEAVIDTLIVLACVSTIVAAWRWRLYRRLEKDSVAIRSGTRSLPATPTLLLARRLRTSDALGQIWKVSSEKIVPLIFAITVLLAVVGVGHHVTFRAASSAGYFCTASRPGTAASAAFDPKNPCWASGVRVTKGRRYQAVLDIGPEWKDNTGDADANGLLRPMAVHLLATPLKRSWAVAWFRPIVRTGVYGDYEHPMNAAGSPKTASATFVAEQSGEVFVYVNDAIALVPWYTKFFYDNNHGSATFHLCEVRSVAESHDDPVPACPA
jgi:uncharacterized protein (DUF2235 family)